MNTITYDDTLYQLVPKEPTPDHIESMALRFDHGHGIKQDFPPETDDQFKMRQEFNRRVARQMYEEATGQGFFKIAAPTPPAQPAERKPLSSDDVFTLTGQAVVMKNDGKTDMPAYFLELAERIAETIGDEALASRTREIGSAHGIKGES